MSDFSELTISGEVVTPSDPGWDEARMAWNLTADQRPEAVALVESAVDVATTVAFATARDLRVSAQGTGHGAGPLGSLEGAILIKTERMRGIEIDAEARIARVEAGVQGSELGAAGGEHGLCFLPGSAPDVGVIGYTLGGGLSWLGRRHGFACNRVESIELVTADGEARTVDAAVDPDLFWALRGGGGGYAIVTALRVSLLPIAEVYAGALLFEAELGGDAVRAYRDWAASAPETVSTVVRFLTPPPVPDVPEPLRGRPLLTIDGACIGSREEGEAAFAPLRELGEPIVDTLDWMPTAGLGRIHMDPENPVPGLGDGMTISELSDETIEAFVSLAGPGSDSPLLLSELRHLGGALGRPAEGGGALSRIDAGFVMYSVGIAPTPEARTAVSGYLDRVEETMGPWRTGRYFNFSDRPCDVESILPPEVCLRLAEVKRRYDPQGRIVAKHAVATAA